MMTTRRRIAPSSDSQCDVARWSPPFDRGWPNNPRAALWKHGKWVAALTVSLAPTLFADRRSAAGVARRHAGLPLGLEASTPGHRWRNLSETRLQSHRVGGPYASCTRR